MATKLLHENGEDYSFSYVSVQVDGKIYDLPVENGEVTVENQKQLRHLTEQHGGFFPVNEDEAEELPEYVLENKSVSEISQYIRDISDVDRLKELRKKEKEHKDRKTAVEAIDNRIGELNSSKPVEQKVEEEEKEDDEVSEEDETESEEDEDEE